MDLRKLIRDIPDYPKEGILFFDITPLLGDAAGFARTIDLLAERFAASKPTKIVAAEARGFIFGAALAYKMGIGFVPVRKPGKLPYKTKSVTYDLEYGSDTLCMSTTVWLATIGQPISLVNPSNLEAVLTVSPITVKSSRWREPMLPTTAGPACNPTPIRNCQSPSWGNRSCIQP